MCRYFPALFVILVSICYQSVVAQIATYVVRVESLLKMQQGIGWPVYLQVAEGHEALMKLSNSLVNQQSCTVTSPSGLTFDVSSPPNNRYESWSEGCGVRVRDVVPSDSGRWRLTAIRGNDSITGWSEVHVEGSINAYTPSPISLQAGDTDTQVDLTSLNNSYCIVAQPFSESSLVPGHCKVTLDRTTRAVQGRWNLLLGLPGRVSELQVERNVAVEAEQLDAGYVRDTVNDKLNLYCNILHSDKNITFCRFQKNSASSGFNIMDGLSDGRHSYYGDGFAKRQCGMTIESISSDDYGTWRCTVGTQHWVGTTVQPSSPMQALIRVQNSATRDSKIRRAFENSDGGTRTLFVQNATSFTITCNADASLSYCWFQHPNGHQFTPVEQDLNDEHNQAFWYSGEGLQNGECGITFATVTEEDTGRWTCHMGARDLLGIETTDDVEVRVTGPLAATQKQVEARIGGTATLYCHTSNGNRPLDYCRFLTPTLVGINVDSSVTAENAILDRYYFTPDRGLDYGDCSLTINPVKQEDIGEWTCAALLHDDVLESRDAFIVELDGSRTGTPQFRADVFGSVFGIAVLLIVLVGVAWYKRDNIRAWHRGPTSNSTDAISLETRSQISSPRTSNNTAASDSTFNDESSSSNEMQRA